MFFKFGEKVEGYDFLVINERQARSSAALMFVFGLVSTLMVFGAFGHNDMFFIEVFSITFIIEFVIRMLISPRYAPYMILSGLFLYGQQPEWVEAKPKQFAWGLGLILAIVMAYFIIFDIMSPIRMITCVLCLFLLSLESGFGICLGCLIYKKLNFKLNGACPGGTCDMPAKLDIDAKRFVALLASLALFVAAYIITANKYEHYKSSASHNMMMSQTNDPDCQPPHLAVMMGKEQLWKEHNCK